MTLWRSKGLPAIRIPYILKLGIFALCIALITATFISKSAYENSLENLVDGLQKEQNAIVSVAALQISGTDYDNIFFDPDYGLDGEAEFNAIQSDLQTIRDQLKMPHGDGVSPLYTLRPAYDFSESGQLEFVVMTDPNKNGDFGISAPLPVESCHKQVLEGETIVTDLYTDDHGEWLTVAAPIYNEDNTIVTILQGDREASVVRTKIKEELYDLIAIALIGILSAQIIAFIVSLYLVRPITRLRDSIQAYEAGEETCLTPPPKDEVGDLFQKMNSLIKRLEDMKSQKRKLLHLCQKQPMNPFCS